MTIERIFFGADHPQAGQLKETVEHQDPPAKPLTLTKKDCRLHVLQGLMAANSSTSAAARARMQDIRSQVVALVPDTDAKRRALGALEAWREDGEFTKTEFQVIVSDIRGGTNMTAGEETQINANWPEV
jgi:prephenate dehydratase